MPKNEVIQAFEVLNQKNAKIILDLATIVSVDGDQVNVRFADGNVKRCLFNPTAQITNGDACIVARADKLNTWIVVCAYVDPSVGRKDGSKPVPRHVPAGTLSTNVIKDTFTALAVSTTSVSLGDVTLDTRGGALLVSCTGYASRSNTSFATITFSIKINGSTTLIPETYVMRLHGTSWPQNGFSFSFPTSTMPSRNHTIEITAVASANTITVDTITLSVMEI